MHVTDPVLLKECKLWRETFPHIRVRGTAIKSDVNGSTGIQSTKSVQAVDKNQIELNKLNEKREKIKRTVVSQIVDRLINKLNLSKENLSGNGKVIEVDKDDRKANLKSSRNGLEKESYFERGKGKCVKDKTCKTGEVEALLGEKSNTPSDLSDDFELSMFSKTEKTEKKSALWNGKHNSKTASETRNNLAKNEEILRSGKLTFQINEKSPSARFRTDRTDSASNIFKPFEMTKKIDKKYESMLERILENKGYNRTGGELRKYPKKVTCETGNRQQKCQFSEESILRKYKELPKLNNFSNNWMSRAERNISDSNAVMQGLGRNSIMKEQMDKNSERQLKSQSCRSDDNFYQYDDKFMEELKREMFGLPKSGKTEYKEEISLKRPQMNYRLNNNYTAKTPKSSSCGDLPKKTKKSLKKDLRMQKNESSVKAGPKNKNIRGTGNQNLQLPPIESSKYCHKYQANIICQYKFTNASFFEW